MGGSEARYALGLGRVSGVGPVIGKMLVRAFGSAKAVLEAKPSALTQLDGVGPKLAAALRKFHEWEAVDREVEQAARFGVDLLPLGSSVYPSLLSEIPDPPLCLYVKGKLEAEENDAVAIVGSRGASRDGVRAAGHLAGELVHRGVTVVSGMARGIDAAAHRSAMEAGGRTLAVLGCGMDVVYPAENVRLYKSIPERGAILSEYAFGTKPDAGNFPLRNRIISGLVRGVVVVEAAEKSGSLITAQRALDQGREVFAVPGSIYSRGSKGTNALIQQGAKLVSGVDDILEELFPDRKGAPGALPPPDLSALSPLDRIVLERLGSEAIHVDEIIESCGLGAARVSEILLRLELVGFVEQFAGKLFARK
ncbi:MAG: DNA-protecting protein DprA [Nitrospirae bacterium]|nr:DNA-protecting protein DprA [Nitrospirota bacterium]